MRARTLAVAAPLVACALTLGPSRAAAQSGATSAGPTSAGAADTLTLDAALKTALARDPHVAAAGSAVDVAAATRSQVRAAWFPTVSGSANLTRYELPWVVAPLHGFDPRTPPLFDNTLEQGRLVGAWTLIDGGARAAQVRGASARVDAAEAGSDQARSDAVLQLLQSYLNVLGARDALAAQRARETELTAEHARAERFVAEGAAARLELLRADAELATARAQGVGADANVRVAEADLARKLGWQVGRVSGARLVEVRTDSATLVDTAGPSPDHPQLRQARAMAAAAEATVREARSAWIPRVSGNGALAGYGGAGTFSKEWQAGLQLDYPIFNGGAREARIDAARADARRAADEERAIEDALATADEQARAGLAQAAAQASALTVSLASYQELVRTEQLALDEGKGVQSEFLSALAGLDAARSSLQDARRAVVLAAARVASVEGRLDQGWVESHTEDVR